LVREELSTGGTALPWADIHAFINRILAIAKADYEAAGDNEGWTFFDRGVFDALSGKAEVDGAQMSAALVERYRYHRLVFLTPPWPEIYQTDSQRRHGLGEAEHEYRRLSRDYPRYGYEPVVLPKVDVASRADFVERTLAAHT
jgi:predicted ATPase